MHQLKESLVDTRFKIAIAHDLIAAAYMAAQALDAGSERSALSAITDATRDKLKAVVNHLDGGLATARWGRQAPTPVWFLRAACQGSASRRHVCGQVAGRALTPQHPQLGRTVPPAGRPGPWRGFRVGRLRGFRPRARGGRRTRVRKGVQADASRHTGGAYARAPLCACLHIGAADRTRCVR